MSSPSHSSPNRPAAWKQTKQQTRRMQLWMKNSLSSFSSRNNEPLFVAEEDASPSTPVAWDAEDSFAFQEEDYPQYPPGIFCSTLDEAMAALHEAYEDPQAPFVAQIERDWILDGDPGVLREQARSKELMKELASQAADLDRLLEDSDGEDGDGDADVSPVSEGQNNQVGHHDDNDNDDDDGFGAFQSAQIVEMKGSRDGAECVNEVAPDDERLVSEKALPLQQRGAEDVQSPKEDDVHRPPVSEIAVPSQQQQGVEKPPISGMAPLTVQQNAHVSNVALSLQEQVIQVDEPSSQATPRHRQDLYAPTSIYQILPQTEVVASPEGRFARRQLENSQPSRDSDDSTGDLDDPGDLENYPKTDPTLQVLRSVQWEHVPLVSRHPDLSLLDDHVTRHLSELDARNVKIQARIMQDIGTRTHLLDYCNRLLQELDQNLVMAQMYASRTGGSLKCARGSEDDYTGVVGSEILLREFDRRDQYKELRSVLGKSAALVERERRLRERIECFGVNGDYKDILSIASRVRLDALQDEDLMKLECLADLRQRVMDVFETFRERIEAVLRAYVARICQSPRVFSTTDYGSLLDAAFEVHRAGVQGVSEVQGDIYYLAMYAQWTKSIEETLNFQVDKCFARALLDPTDAGDSEYDKDLIQLGFELRNDDYDAAKLLSLTHNLVTIRFAFESELNYLPMVYHRLCALLTDVLHSHDILIRWHSDPGHERNDGEIARLLCGSKIRVWRRCEDALAKCLDRYLHTATKRDLFPPDESDEGCTWIQDLEDMHDIFRLTHQFLSLGPEYLNLESFPVSHVTCLSDSNAESDLYTKLGDVCRKHLRAVHVQAMNSTGFMLYKEDWSLVGLKAQLDPGSGSEGSVEERLLEAVLRLSPVFEPRGLEAKPRYWHNAFVCATPLHLFDLDTKGNPFLNFQESNDNAEYGGRSKTKEEDRDAGGDKWSGLTLQSPKLSFFEDASDLLFNLATQSVASGIMKWFARLLSVVKKLPLIVEDVCEVMTNLCDLYFTTVFRLCAGTAKHEEVLLGLAPPAPLEVSREQQENPGARGTTNRKQPSGSLRIAGFGRRPSQTKQPVRRKHNHSAVPRTVEADICAPLSPEMEDIAALRNFIKRGQESLEGIVNLQKIEQWISDPSDTSSNDHDIRMVSDNLAKREGAVWSCLFVSQLLSVTLSFTKHCLRDSLLGHRNPQESVIQQESVGKEDSRPRAQQLPTDAFAAYVIDSVHVTPVMVKVASRISAVRAIMGRLIVQEILAVDSVWEESQLNEQSNSYVDSLCDRIADLWKLMSTSKSPLPSAIRQKTFEHMVEGGYLSLLEGFSRVPFCSTEGRSLMSMDLSYFSGATNPRSVMERIGECASILPPSPVSIERGKEYVDTYIKVFYYPEDDIMRWIVANHSHYQLNHALALLTSGAYDRLEYEDRDIIGLVWDVKNLYTERGCDPRTREAS